MVRHLRYQESARAEYGRERNGFLVLEETRARTRNTRHYRLCGIRSTVSTLAGDDRGERSCRAGRFTSVLAVGVTEERKASRDCNDGDDRNGARLLAIRRDS